MKESLTVTQAKRRERLKRIRKRRIVICLLIIFVICIAVFCILLKTKLFPVKNITAKGSQLYSSAEIVSASGINNKTPIMSISEDAVKSRISKNLSYIETVRIKKTFPDTVLITVSDAEEYYAFRTDNGYCAVSRNGQVLNFYDELPENTVEVAANGLKLSKGEAVEFESTAQREIFELLSTYPDKKGIRLDGIDITDSVRITITVEDRFEVNLGNKENLKEKIDHLAGMIPEIGERSGKINLEMWTFSDSKGTFIANN